MAAKVLPLKKKAGSKTYYTLTHLEERACAFAVDALCRRWHKHQITAELKRKFGIMQVPRREAVITAAKRRMRMSLKVNPVREIAKSKALYEAVIRDPRAPWRERMLAQERLDKMFGLEGHSDLSDPEPELDPKQG
jgi:hypothetical protein